MTKKNLVEREKRAIVEVLVVLALLVSSRGSGGDLRESSRPCIRVAGTSPVSNPRKGLSKYLG